MINNEESMQQAQGCELRKLLLYQEVCIREEMKKKK